MGTTGLSSATHSAADVVALLGLERLPHEGGWFRRYFPDAASEASGSDAPHRETFSLIHALFTPDEFSALHRLRSPEVWCWQAGDPLECLRLYPDGTGASVRLGLDGRAGERLHDVVGAGVWHGARLAAGGRWALVACVVVPEFDWSDFEPGARGALLASHPRFAEEILALTRAP